MRTWTLEEATAALPQVRELVRRARTLAARAKRSSPRTLLNGGASTNGHGPSRVGPGVEGAELRATVEELEALGIVVRDPGRGLIDFPARSPTGRDYLLCWLEGEDAIEWWHWLDAGFAGRTPLTQPPE